jgi:hypothetical protein
LRVLVVNEPELAEAINRLRGEWAERSGGELSALATAWDQLIKLKSIDADVVVFPSRYLGELCMREWLRPVRPNVLESKELNIEDVFPLVRRKLLRWGGEVMALPLGIDPLTLRPDEREQPGIALLVEAVRASSDQGDNVLFDIETMKPRITDPAFIENLERLPRRGDTTVLPVLGYSDRLIAVTSASRNAASAFKLLAWLAQADTSSQLAQAGSPTFPVRESLAASPTWYGSEMPAEERLATGSALKRMLTAQQCLSVPRIPGVDQYMTALDEAVRSVINSESTPEEALQKAAQHWEQITDVHGREAQREAYLEHLGINE